jgi:hypothetical protein
VISAVADGEGALGRLDQAVDVLEPLAALDPEAVEQAEDDQRGEPLRRRRHVVDGRVLERERQRLGKPRLVTCGDRRASPRCQDFEIGGDLAPTSPR